MKRIARLVGQKYMNDTTEYKQLQHYGRLAELESIMKVQQSGKFFEKQFNEYPKQYRWNNLNKDLNVYLWDAKSKPRGIVVYYSSFADYVGVTAPMAKQLSQSGFTFTGFDYPNFGKSETTEHGYVESNEQIMQHCENFLIHTRKKYPKMPIFVMGHSIGGLLALQLGLKSPRLINGCLFINPFLQTIDTRNSLQKRIRRFLPTIPTITFNQPQYSQHSILKYKQKDKLIFTPQNPTTSMNMQNLMTACRPLFKQFTVPYLAIQGGTDKIANPFTVFDLEQQSKSVDKQTVIIHEMWHGVWFDDRLSEVIQLSKLWLKLRA